MDDYTIEEDEKEYNVDPVVYDYNNKVFEEELELEEEMTHSSKRR